MPFDNDDLKRLKGELDGIRPRRIAIQLDALLARLEAAEKALQSFLVAPLWPTPDTLKNDLEAWRKAAGKK